MNQDLYKEGELKLAIAQGKLVLVFDSKGLDVRVALDSDYFIDQLAALIPGTLDDTMFALVKAALKA